MQVRLTGGSTTTVLSIAVNDIAPLSLVYSSGIINVYTINSLILIDLPTSTGGAITSYSISPALPAGLTFNPSTGAISGTPLIVLSATNYTIVGSNSGGTIQANKIITIKDLPPPILTYQSNPAIYTLGQAVSNYPSVGAGGSGVTYTISPVLPAGLTLNSTSGLISGTTSALSAVQSYTVTGTNSSSTTLNSISISVVPPSAGAPTSFHYSSATLVYILGMPIPNSIPITSGGTPTTYSITGTGAFPVGLTLNSSTGVISGTPTSTVTSTSYTVTASNSSGKANAAITITVAAKTAYSTINGSYIVGLGISPNNFSPANLTGATYSVSPSLPNGLSLNASTGVISGIPSSIAPNATYKRG